MLSSRTRTGCHGWWNWTWVIDTEKGGKHGSGNGWGVKIGEPCVSVSSRLCSNFVRCNRHMSTRFDVPRPLPCRSGCVRSSPCWKMIRQGPPLSVIRRKRPRRGKGFEPFGCYA